MVRGRDRARPRISRPTEEQAPFFAPTLRARRRADAPDPPYISPDTNEWVVANVTLIPQAGRPQARDRALRGHDRELPPRDGPQRPVRSAGRGRPHGPRRDRRRASSARRRAARRDRRPPVHRARAHRRRESGVVDVDGRRSAYRRVQPSAGNANDWILVSSANGARPDRCSPATAGVPLAMLAVGLILDRAGRTVAARRPGASWRPTATTDALTGLGNRRKLLADLAAPGQVGDRRAPGGAHAVRPQRLQELQRHLRPPGRRRPAAAPRRGARGGGRAVRRARLPAGRRRVLRHRRRARDATRSSGPPPARSRRPARASRSRPRSEPW